MKAAVVQSAMPSSPTANQDFTDGVFSSDVKAGLCFLSRGVTSNTIAEHSGIGIGVIDSAATQRAWSTHNQDALGTSSDVRQEMSTTQIALFADAAANDTIAEAVGSILSNGVRAAWSDWNANELVSMLMIGGSDVEASVVSATLNGTTDVTVNHGLSAAPHVIICVSSGEAASSNGTYCHSIGFYDVGAATYRGLSYRENNAATTLIAQKWMDSSIASEHSNTADTWNATINDVGATSFDVVASAATTDVLFFLCIRVTGGTFKVGDFTTRTTTGTQADISGMAAAPKAVIYATSFLSSASGAGTIVNDTNCESFGIGAAVNNESVTQQAASAKWADDAVVLGTTDTKSLTSGNKAGVAFNGSGALAYAFDIESWDSGGVTHDYTTVDGTARRVIYLAIAPAAAFGNAPRARYYEMMRNA